MGQGDSALVVFPQGATMLIDAGGEIRLDRTPEEDTGEAESPEADPHYNSTRSYVGEMVVSRFLWSLGLSRIDYVIVTHPDRDHIGGFSEVLRNFRIGQAVIADAPSDNEEARSFAASVSKRAIPAAVVGEGESYEIQGVTVDVLWPPANSDANSSGSNDRSLVIRLVYGSVAILLTGDIERAAEDTLVRSGRDIRADLIKVPHHGSKTSSGEAFLDAVSPGYAVISVGERSPFGHPHDTVVARYMERGIKLYQTGRDGTISVETDGVSIEMATHRR